MVDDVRFALRSLAKTPIVTVVVLVSLAVGIGATTAVFSAANAFLFRPPSAATEDPDSLATVFTSDGDGGAYGRNSVLDTQAIRDSVDAFEAVAPHRFGIVELEGPDWVRSSMIEIVSGNYFDVLGVDFSMGRSFLASETAFGRAERVVVIGAQLWQERFGGEPSAIGETLILDGDAFTVIGIAPADLRSRFLALEVDAWVPVETSAQFRAAEYATLLERIRSRPEIDDAQIGSAVEGTSFAFDTGGDVVPVGYTPAPGEMLRISFNAVTPGYFELLQIRLLSGRAFTEADHGGAEEKDRHT